MFKVDKDSKYVFSDFFPEGDTELHKYVVLTDNSIIFFLEYNISTIGTTAYNRVLFYDIDDLFLSITDMEDFNISLIPPGNPATKGDIEITTISEIQKHTHGIYHWFCYKCQNEHTYLSSKLTNDPARYHDTEVAEVVYSQNNTTWLK